MNDDANWYEKTKRIVRATTYCVYAFWSAVCIQHSIKKVLQVTKPLNVRGEVKTSCITSMAVKSFLLLTGWERLLGGERVYGGGCGGWGATAGGGRDGGGFILLIAQVAKTPHATFRIVVCHEIACVRPSIWFQMGYLSERPAQQGASKPKVKIKRQH